jgi:hypothetical protein
MKMFLYINKAGGFVRTKLKKVDVVAFKKESQCVIFYRPNPKYSGYADTLYVGDGRGEKNDKTYFELSPPGALLSLAEILSACTGLGCELLTREQFPNVEMAFKFI